MKLHMCSDLETKTIQWAYKLDDEYVIAPSYVFARIAERKYHDDVKPFVLPT